MPKLGRITGPVLLDNTYSIVPLNDYSKENSAEIQLKNRTDTEDSSLKPLKTSDDILNSPFNSAKELANWQKKNEKNTTGDKMRRKYEG